MSNTWSSFDIDGDEERGYRTTYRTNDDNDDGYPDGEVAKLILNHRTLALALACTGGGTRIGFYGQPVTVRLNGREIKTKRLDGIGSSARYEVTP